MKSRKRAPGTRWPVRLSACLAMLAMLAWPTSAEDDENAEPSEDQTPRAQEEAANEAVPAEQEDATPAEEVFTPSENISEDIAVPLPVDI